MGQTKVPVTQAVHAGELAMRVFDDAWVDNVMDRDERVLFREVLLDWLTWAKAARSSVMTGLAFMKGIESEAYQDRLVAEYRASLDEVPPIASAAD